MAKRKTSAGLTNLERFGGTAFFVFYLLLLPLAAGPARRLAEELLDRRISEELYGAVYYYALFALVHVWQFAVANRDPAYFLRMVQYLIPGLVLAWAYDHSGTLWSSISLHAGVNALSALAGSL